MEGVGDVGTAATNPRGNRFSAGNACTERARSSGSTIGGMTRTIDSEAEHRTDVYLCRVEAILGMTSDIERGSRREDKVVVVVGL